VPATESVNIVATWGGVAFQEVYELGLPVYGGVRKDRSSSGTSTGWSDEVGDVSISAYGIANMNTGEYGKRKQLVVSGGGVSLTLNAVCTAVSATPEVNGFTRFTFTAKLLDG
jgi:hypothetical protein